MSVKTLMSVVQRNPLAVVAAGLFCLKLIVSLSDGKLTAKERAELQLRIMKVFNS
jgi:hypothetical protein